MNKDFKKLPEIKTESMKMYLTVLMVSYFDQLKCMCTLIAYSLTKELLICTNLWFILSIGAAPFSYTSTNIRGTQQKVVS